MTSFPISMTNNGHILKWLVLFFMCALFFGRSVFAAGDNFDSHDFQISPVKYDISIKDGETYSTSIFLRNLSLTTSHSIDVEIEDFIVTDGVPSAEFFVPGANHPMKAYDVINWIDIAREKIYLAPDESRRLPVKITVPKDTPTGGYYGAIFFKQQAEEGEGDVENAAAKIEAIYRLGALIVIGVEGKEPITRSGEISGFSTENKITFNGPVSFDVNVSNSGNIPYMVSGDIKIYQWGREKKAIAVGEDESSTLYVKKTRLFKKNWDYKSWNIGRYTAVVRLISGEGDVSMEKKIVFWVLPWKSIIGFSSVILLFFMIYTFGKKRGSRK